MIPETSNLYYNSFLSMSFYKKNKSKNKKVILLFWEFVVHCISNPIIILVMDVY